MRFTITMSRYLARSNYEITGVTFQEGGTISLPEEQVTFEDLSLVNQTYVKEKLDSIETDVDELVTVLNKHNYPEMKGEFVKDSKDDYVLKEILPASSSNIVSVTLNSKGFVVSYSETLDLSRTRDISITFIDRGTLPNTPQDYLVNDRILRFTPYKNFINGSYTKEETLVTLSDSHQYKPNNNLIVGSIEDNLEGRYVAELKANRYEGLGKDTAPYMVYPEDPHEVMSTNHLEEFSKRFPLANTVRDKHIGDLAYKVTKDNRHTLVPTTDGDGLMIPHEISSLDESGSKHAKKSIYHLLYSQGGGYTPTKSNLRFGKGYLSDVQKYAGFGSLTTVVPGDGLALHACAIVPISEKVSYFLGGSLPLDSLTQEEVTSLSLNISVFEFKNGVMATCDKSDLSLPFPIKGADAISYGDWSIIRNHDGKYYKLSILELKELHRVGKGVINLTEVSGQVDEVEYLGKSTLTLMGNTLVSGHFDETSYVYEIMRDGSLSYRGLFTELFGDSDSERGKGLRPKYPYSQVHYGPDGSVTLACTRKDYREKAFGGVVDIPYDELYGKRCFQHRSGHYEIISSTEIRREAYESQNRKFDCPNDILSLNGVLYAVDSEKASGYTNIVFYTLNTPDGPNNSVSPMWQKSHIYDLYFEGNSDEVVFGFMTPGLLFVSAASRNHEGRLSTRLASIGGTPLSEIGFKMSKLVDVFGEEYVPVKPEGDGVIQGKGFRLPHTPSIFKGGEALPTFIQGGDFSGFNKAKTEISNVYLEDDLSPVPGDGKLIIPELIYIDKDGVTKKVPIKPVDGKINIELENVAEIVEWGYYTKPIKSGNIKIAKTLDSGKYLTKVPDHSPNWLTNADEMFKNCSIFNQDLDTWDTSKVKGMRAMFSGAAKFNGKVGNWDVSSVTTMYDMFKGATVFNQDLNNWDVSNVRSMSYMFFHAEAFNRNIGSWDTGKLSSMAGMFFHARSFNQDINNWDVSNVTTMEALFANAVGFNQPLENWVLSKVTSTRAMFSSATQFNQDIGDWDMSSVTDTRDMFWKAISFNQDLDKWDTSEVTQMTNMFSGAEKFNQDISEWDVGKVTDMYRMFSSATVFNQDLSSWCVKNITTAPDDFDTGAVSWSKSRPIWGTCKYLTYIDAKGVKKSVLVTKGSDGNVLVRLEDAVEILDWGRYEGDYAPKRSIEIASTPEMGSLLKKVPDKAPNWINSMHSMFKDCSNFNQDLDKWDVSEVTDLGYTFQGCSKFNGDISTWDVSKVTRLAFTFANCSVFNGDISQWKTDSLTGMTATFIDCEKFNSDISSWNVSNVRDFASVFRGALSFNAPISKWDTSSVVNIFMAFRDAKSFNQDIGKWDTGKVTNMTGMFQGASNFNQDLKAWCVKSIKTTPSTFDEGAISWKVSRPVWGTCPPRK